MKAVIITAPGGPEVLQLVERPKPEPAHLEVLIRVAAAGVNRPDVAQRKGIYPPPPGAPPDILGLEVSGTIVKCGSGISRWKEGDRVCALVIGGGYAEFVTANEKHCLPVPIHWDYAGAASLPETVFTVWHNVFQRGKLIAGEHLLVHGGSSGIGITAIQLAKAFGARITVTVGNEEKCKACMDLGADKCINYNSEDFEALLIHEGADVILDMVGGTYINKNIKILKPDGRLVFINTMKGSKAEINIMDIMQRRLTITGSTLRSRDIKFKGDLAAEVERYVWPVIEEGKFRPVIYKKFELKDADKAHTLMESSEHIGKIVLTVP